MGEFIMPSLGSQMIEARLIQWYVKPGDTVTKGDIIGEIHTEKGLIDIEALENGIISELRIKEGETVPVGAVMAVIENDAAKKADEPAEISVDKKMKENGKSEKPEPGLEKQRRPKMKASPLARRIAEDLQVDLNTITGSGPGGTIHKKDVEAAAASKPKEKPGIVPETLEKAPTAATERKETFSEKEIVPPETDSMRKAIAAAMSLANREIPHYYLESDIDMKKALEWLEDTNKKRPLKERFLPPVLLIKATANALVQVPQLNGFWIEDTLQIKDSIHIGFTISLRRGGLMIPAILDADTKSLDEIREEFVDMISRAREGKLRTGEIGKATVTITSLGERGAGKVYGVIYPPQVALIGFGNILHHPRAVDGAIGIRPVLSAVLAADHRATDGHTGSRFLEILDEQLQNPESI
jgi:pyruvate dehydrogenase E2 component (dihydrolipoamide acetyltransferase)